MSEEKKPLKQKKTKFSLKNSEKEDISVTSTPTVEMLVEDPGKENAVQNIKRYLFYKDGYIKSLGIFIFNLLLLIVSVYSFYYANNIYAPPVKFLPLDRNGSIIDLVPLSKPVKTDEERRQFVQDVILDILAYNYTTVETHGAKVKKYFTSDSFNDYMTGFKNSTDVKRVVRNHYVVLPVPRNVPILIKKPVSNRNQSNEVLFYQYRIKIRKILRNHEGVLFDSNDLIITLRRVSVTENIEGLAVHNIRAAIEKDGDVEITDNLGGN
jgi:hypothetical protein